MVEICPQGVLLKKCKASKWECSFCFTPTAEYLWLKKRINKLKCVWFVDIPATMSSPTSTPGSHKRGRNGNPGTRKFICSTVPLGATEMIVGGVCLCPCILVWSCFCALCILSQQWGPHISSVSAAQRPGLLYWGPDADAHLPCHGHAQSSSPSGHFSVLQPTSFR